MHPEPTRQGDKAPSVHEHIVDNRAPHDARDDINRRRKRRDDGAARGYHPRRGGCYDNGEDQNPSLKTLGPWVFSKTIHRAHFPDQFRQPANLTKYSGETSPELWLVDYHLACQLGGVKDDRLIIRNLPLLSDTARAWLEHLPLTKFMTGTT